MGFDSTFAAFNISSSGLSAERQRMEVVANNIANASTTRTPEGGAYKRQDLIFEAVLGRTSAKHGTAAQNLDLAGVNVAGKYFDDSEMPRVYNPGHPDADLDGFVTMPNVKLPIEMVNLITATRAYEANLKAAQSFSDMGQQAIALLKGQ